MNKVIHNGLSFVTWVDLIVSLPIIIDGIRAGSFIGSGEQQVSHCFFSFLLYILQHLHTKNSCGPQQCTSWITSTGMTTSVFPSLPHTFWELEMGIMETTKRKGIESLPERCPFWWRHFLGSMILMYICTMLGSHFMPLACNVNLHFKTGSFGFVPFLLYLSHLALLPQRQLQYR